MAGAISPEPTTETVAMLTGLASSMNGYHWLEKFTQFIDVHLARRIAKGL